MNPSIKDFMKSIESQIKEMTDGKNRQSQGTWNIPVQGGYIQISAKFLPV